ncbi:YfhO family protein [Flavobacterium orientale]|uniref:Membrane protein n=1 Tax=Flavobacterium orientale TaxID=1756020 RepID=A0A916Y212_9FLAO|nr:YfhO family protein [Flavobacterium orientale]GGD27332.1 membrane protein [Flavobacterium orientale]
MKNISKYLPHLIAFVGFVAVSLFYFYPVLQGKQISQSDIVQYTGMAKEQNDFRAQTGEEPFWTNSAFGGMPTYQLGAKYPHNYVKSVDGFLRFLPRPADYLFLYFLGFYILLIVLKIDPLKAFFGALAFGFSTYLIIILGVGHNAKAHAIAYMPMVIAGVLLVFQKRFIVGGLLTMIAAALEIQANHFQMTYYLLLLLLVISVYYIYKLVKAKEFKNIGIAFGVFMIAGLLALGANATNLLATAEYTEFSTRGKNELTFGATGETLSKNSGMSYEYITEYSYGIAESLNLIAPRLFGGGNSEQLGEKSNLYDLILRVGATPDEAADFANNAPTYWGDQPIVAAPAYIGAIVFFLFLMALFAEKRKIKYAFLVGAIFSLFLSWGKNFPLLTDFFIDYFPLYNKFRAVSSIQVLLELCVPVLAIMGLHSFFKLDKDAQWKALWKSSAIALGLLAFLLLIKGAFSFSTEGDAYYLQAYGELGQPFIEALTEDRKAMYTSDLLRSMGLIALVFAVLWLFTKEKISQTLAIILVGCVMVFDLVLIDKNYVSSEAFVNSREVEQPFQPTQADMQILQDSTLHYRVFEPRGTMQNARTSYFHKSIGGYSAVKSQRMQQLYDFHISKVNAGVLNMLNVKYIIQADEQRQTFASINAFANGNAWFVDEVVSANSADEEIRALDSLNTKIKAVLSTKDFPAISKEVANRNFKTDSLSIIKLVDYQPNFLKYETQNSNDGLAVFSEIYYPKGWKVTIDGKETEMFRVNYVLRALQVPAGKHTIEFKFEPDVVKKGSIIALFSSLGMLLLLLGGTYFQLKKKGKE